ncbi:MAG TPA: hypothetical protein VJB57_10675 [Dehalococcoidia bacterium]|nr:hypothetical protein [Dehalococcoidia bacterium]
MRREGHDVVWVLTDASSSPDPTVLARAQAQDRIVRPSTRISVRWPSRPCCPLQAASFSVDLARVAQTQQSKS